MPRRDPTEQLELAARELSTFLSDPTRAAPDQAEVVAERLDQFCRVAAGLEAEHRGEPAALRLLQERFRQATAPAFQGSWLMSRARTWPQGYPGDYLTLEAVYQRAVNSEGQGAHLDAFFQRQTLAVAVRSRLRTLAALLRRRAAEEGDGARWLNLACGSARELLEIPAQGGRTLFCVDQDEAALAYGEALLAQTGHQITWQDRNALRFISADATRRRYGALTTIYSAGLFDYLDDRALGDLLRGLYEALAPGGLLIAAFKDAERYEAQPYHWLVRWHYFHQRTEGQFREILAQAGIPADRLELTRDETGVILFFQARR